MPNITDATDYGLWYFAHPYTCQDKDGNYVPEAEDANFMLACMRSGDLLLRGYNIYSPICHTHPIHRACPTLLKAKEHMLWYLLDNEFIDSADWKGIILAPDWEDSKGCVAEYKRIAGKGGEVKEYSKIMYEPITYHAV